MSDEPQQAFVPSPEYLAREKRFYDAVALRKPDRVPVASLAAFFVTRYAGLTNAEAMHRLPADGRRLARVHQEARTGTWRRRPSRSSPRP